jgi:hypothetical protein
MWPALLLVGVGRRRRVILPGPLFLLWPLLALGWLVLGLWNLARVAFLGPEGARRPGSNASLRAALTLIANLSGLSVDVAARDGRGVYIRLI